MKVSYKSKSSISKVDIFVVGKSSDHFDGLLRMKVFVTCFIFESISEFGILPLQISSTSARAQSCQFLFEANNIRHQEATTAVVSKPAKYIFLQLSIMKRSLASCVRLLFLALSITICNRSFSKLVFLFLSFTTCSIKLFTSVVKLIPMFGITPMKNKDVWSKR